MKLKTFKRIGVLAVCVLATLPSMAQQTYQEIEQLTVNENVTTVITATEPVRFVDISTDAVVGDQPINNTIRLKPKEGADVCRWRYSCYCNYCNRALSYTICTNLYHSSAGSSI